MLVVLVVDILILDESYPSTLLVYKARRLRHETGNWSLHAKHEEWDVGVRELATKYLVRPLQIIITPICFCMGMYAAFVYGILYLLVCLSTSHEHTNQHQTDKCFANRQVLRRISDRVRARTGLEPIRGVLTFHCDPHRMHHWGSSKCIQHKILY